MIQNNRKQLRPKPKNMDLKDIQNLIKFVAKSGASEVKLEMEDINWHDTLARFVYQNFRQ